MDTQIRCLFNTLPARRRERSLWRGIVLFVCCGSIWLLSLAGVVLSPLWIFPVAVLANGITMSMLFIVGHDACHGSLVPALRLNRMIGTLAFLPSLHPFSGWKRSHNGMHHVWTNLKGEDPGYPPFSLDEFRRLTPLRRLLERFYRSWAGIGFFYFAEVYWKCLLFPRCDRQPPQRREFLLDRILITAYLLLEIVSIYRVSLAVDRSHPLLFTICAVVAPYCFFLWLMAFVTYQHHTNPEIPWFDQKSEWSYFQTQVAGTTHVAFPPVFDFIFLHILDHSAHHVDPLIPLYHLDQSQVALEQAYPGSVKIIGWGPSVLWNTLSCCKLYDYRQHRWLDFNGHPTTPSLIVTSELLRLPDLPPSKPVLQTRQDLPVS